VTFYFDPSCPWTWITSRWLVDVAAQRDLEITWAPFSLRDKRRREASASGRPDTVDEARRRREDDLYRGLRVIVAAREMAGNEAVGRLYTAIGTLIHHDHDDHLQRIAEAIDAAHLPADLIHAADDANLDKNIEVCTDSAKELVGDQVGVPIIMIGGSSETFFGPVMSPAPTGEEALRLWDAFATLERVHGVFEIKRTRTVSPQFGPRPELARSPR
jgi:hypothetical protein